MKPLKTGNLLVILFLALIFGAAFLLAGGLPSTSPNNPFVPTATPAQVFVGSRDTDKNNSLHIDTIPTVLPTPTVIPTQPPLPTKPFVPPVTQPPSSGNECVHFQPVTGNCSCVAGDLYDNCKDKYQTANACTAAGGSPQNQGADCFFPKGSAPCSGVTYCLAKPVIYLYPQHETDVSVVLTVPGIITQSDPIYPSKGWQHILAEPDGTLSYNDKTYHELFYESAVTKKPTITNEVVYSIRELPIALADITSRLGLNPSEQREFLAYWMPRLQSLQSQSIAVSLISKEDKELLDKVTVTPTPDTFIAVLFSFRPTVFPSLFQNASLVLPPTPPHRVGFTVVEWGGAIAEGK